MTFTIKKTKQNRYIWVLYEGNAFVAVSSVHGYDSPVGCFKAIRHLIDAIPHCSVYQDDGLKWV